jgi:hypothetical protein
MVTGTCYVVWNIVAEYPGAEPRQITGLKSKGDVDDRMNGDRRVAWLRAQGCFPVDRPSGFVTAGPGDRCARCR